MWQETAMATADVVETLGGRRALGRAVRDEDDLRESVRSGFPFATVDAVATGLGLERRDELHAVLHLPARTLARRRAARRLHAEESDRLLRVARVLTHARRVFGDADQAARWLRGAVPSLGARTPLSLLDTDVGVQQVEDTLSRLEHGIPG